MIRHVESTFVVGAPQNHWRLLVDGDEVARGGPEDDILRQQVISLLYPVFCAQADATYALAVARVLVQDYTAAKGRRD